MRVPTGRTQSARLSRSVRRGSEPKITSEESAGQVQEDGKRHGAWEATEGFGSPRPSGNFHNHPALGNQTGEGILQAAHPVILAIVHSLVQLEENVLGAATGLSQQGDFSATRRW